MTSVALAKNILAENSRVLYGIFGVIESSGFFPPRLFLNEFLKVGCDPCDQDGRMGSWTPFELSKDDYLTVKDWWIANHPGTIEDALAVTTWDDWVQCILGDYDDDDAAPTAHLTTDHRPGEVRTLTEGTAEQLREPEPPSGSN
ncbi:MAG: hypothetical protein R3C53_19405 [Pirellulaceae bacterium]